MVREPDSVRVPTLTGTVTDGFGRCQHDVEAGVYRPLGTLYPGSLNVRLNTIPRLPAPTFTCTFAGIDRHLWPANLAGRFVWLLHAQHLGRTVELLADVRLRGLLNLSNGDRVKVTL